MHDMHDNGLPILSFVAQQSTTDGEIAVIS